MYLLAFGTLHCIAFNAFHTHTSRKMSQHSKSSSAASSDVNNNKLKILACHGFLQDGATFRNRTGSFRRACKSRVADFVFIDAPIIVSDEQATATLGFTKTGGPSWWAVGGAGNNNDDDDDDGLELSFAALRQAVLTHQPDGLLRFSQGATMISLFLARLHRTEPALCRKIQF